MRAVILAVLAVSGLSACASPREKDCTALLPVVDASQAHPSDENLAKLRAFSAKDQAIGDQVAAYTRSVERIVSGTKAIEKLSAAMKMKSDAGAFSLSMFDASRPHAERLLSLCLPAKAPPECAALGLALDACTKPEKDDTTVEEQLLGCAAGFAAVKSPDAATNESIQALAATLRDFEPFARNVGAPAKEVIAVTKEVLPKISDAQSARKDANAAELKLRALCPRK